MITKITLSQAIAGYLINLSARDLSQNTINDYTNTLRKFSEFQGPDIHIESINADYINAFMAGMKTVSKKTRSNYHSTINTFFEWMIKNNLVDSNPVQLTDRPKPEKRVIDPIPENQIKPLLDAAYYSKPYSRPGKRSCRNKLRTADRNVAMILFFLDNGIRVSELCNLQIKDLDLKQSRAFVMGKGAKERYVPFSARTSQAIWRYHTSRGDLYPDDYVFATDENRRLDRIYVLHILNQIGDRAGIPNVHPHRLRHTFSIMFLRAGGDIFSLQEILGHESSDMSRHYSKLAQSDVKRVHRRASPVEYLRL